MSNHAKVRCNLRRALDNFSYEYTDVAKIQKGSIDLTEAFFKGERYAGPRNFEGNERESMDDKVLGYAVSNVNLVQKYELGIDERPVMKDGRYVVREVDDEIIVGACLCLPYVRNTSLAEVYWPTRKRKKSIQGFDKNLVDRITETAREEHGWFNPARDSLFMFAGQEEMVQDRIELHKLMLKGILDHGSSIEYCMGRREMKLMDKVAEGDLKRQLEKLKTPKNLEHLRRFAYHTEASGTVMESAAYLQEKMKARDKLQEEYARNARFVKLVLLSAGVAGVTNALFTLLSKCG